MSNGRQYVSALGGSRPQLPALTGIRFFAAFHVVLYHWRLWSEWPLPAALKNLLDAGHVAVGLFFALSGFILSYTQFGFGAPYLPLRPYLAGRFARIYPVYAVGLLLTLPFYLHGLAAGTQPGLHGLQYLAVPLLLQAFVPQLALAWNLPSWSLSAEGFFYLLFPWLGHPISRLRPRGAALLIALCWAAMLLPAGLTVLLAPGSWHQFDLFGASWLNVLKYDPLLRLPEFVGGMALARLFAAPGVRGWLRAHGARLELLAAAVLLGVLLGGERLVAYPLLHNGVLLPVHLALILALAEGRGALSRLCALRPLQLLGNASYALYILHMPALYLVASLWRRWAGGASLAHPLELLASVALAIGMSVLVYFAVEKPAHRWLRGVLGKAGAAEPVAPLLDGAAAQ